jgi:DNA-binding transcriptional MocR family regulator
VSPSYVLEPTYEKIRNRLIEGIWPQGERLQALRIADDLGVSMTPVRDALNRLAGERMIEVVPGNGFRTVRMPPDTLRDLLALNRDLLTQVCLARPLRAERTSKLGTGGYADLLGKLYEAIAVATGSNEIVETVKGISSRLHRARQFEPHVIKTSSADLARMIEAWSQAATETLQARLIAFHDERLANTEAIAQLIEDSHPKSS